ncbi:MAG: DUF1232 domain-containing protein [Spirochaetales bacterium]|nr:DUF1232 domain-containing protein [Spirochaetales bacterium]
MILFEKLKEKANFLKKEITTLYYAYKNPGTGPLPRIIIILTLGYALSPIDLIPDFIPVLGYLDDLIILPALIALSIKLIPQGIIEESRKRAEEEPIQFKKNWVAAIIFILIWILIVTGIIMQFIPDIDH